MADEVKILSSPKDFDPPEVKEPEPVEGLKDPAPSFDEFRWQMSQ